MEDYNNNIERLHNVDIELQVHKKENFFGRNSSVTRTIDSLER